MSADSAIFDFLDMMLLSDGMHTVLLMSEMPLSMCVKYGAN